MRGLEKVSEKKQKLIDEKNNSPLYVGEEIYVLNEVFNKHSNNPKSSTLCTIVELKEDGMIGFKDCSLREIKSDRYRTVYYIIKEQIHSRYILEIGENPFDDDFDRIRSINYSFDSILYNLDVLNEKSEFKEKYKFNGIECLNCNWNPYVYGKDGSKYYYQRPFVWSVEDKQLLIESIYQGIDCGKILVRNHSWKSIENKANSGETELSFKDIVDGKQRLNAVRGFLMNEYPDLRGNYFNDLSFVAQNKITNNQLFSYSEMDEDVDDETVLKQFLKLNFAGVPQSKEHIEFVKSLLNK